MHTFVQKINKQRKAKIQNFQNHQQGVAVSQREVFLNDRVGSRSPQWPAEALETEVRSRPVHLPRAWSGLESSLLFVRVAIWAFQTEGDSCSPNLYLS